MNHGGFSHVAFCCCVTWKGPCGAFVTPDFSFFFGGAYVAGLLCLHSDTGLPWSGSQNPLFVDPTTRQEWCRRRHVASPTSLGCVQICPVLAVLTNPACRGPAQIFTMNCKIPVTSKKKHGLKIQMLVNGHSVALETLVAATTHKRTFHQAEVNLQRVFNPNLCS